MNILRFPRGHGPPRLTAQAQAQPGSNRSSGEGSGRAVTPASSPVASRSAASSSGSNSGGGGAACARSTSRTSKNPGPATTTPHEDASRLGTTLRQVLDSPTIGARFREYVAAIRANEGVSFLDAYQMAVQDTADQPDTLETTAGFIMARFILDSADLQVNLKDKTRKTIMEMFHAQSFRSIPELLQDAVFEVFEDVKRSDSFRNFVQEDAEANVLASNANVILLDTWVVSENHKVVLDAIADDDFAGLKVLVRFCVSISEFEREDDKNAKKMRGNKIASTFVARGSLFEVDLPALYVAALSQERFDLLPDVRIECLQRIAANEAAMEAIRRSISRRRGSKQSDQLSDASAAQVAAAKKEAQQEIFAKLMRILLDPRQRQRFVQDAVAKISGEALLKLRFCAAVQELKDAPKRERIPRGRKIVSMFVEVGAMFEIQSIPHGFRHDLVVERPDLKLLEVLAHQFAFEACFDPGMAMLLGTQHTSA